MMQTNVPQKFAKFRRVGAFLGLSALAAAAPWSATVLTAQETARAQHTDTSAHSGQAAIADAARVGHAFATIAERVSPSVVSIRVEVPASRRGMVQQLPYGIFPGGPRDGEEPIIQGGGSGFVISEDGAILTNRHVVENASRIRVHFQDGRDLPATIVGVDRATDLAVLRVQARGLRPLRFANMEEQRVGQWVVAIGSPFGLDTTITAGILSATGRGGLGMNEIEDYLQTDASINPGNSGGPLVNLDGEVVGINTMIVGRGQGIGFAIPADMGQSVAEQLLAHGRVRRAWIGVGFQELTPELASDFGVGEHRGGALVNEVVPGGPAARAGIRNGDVIVGIEGNSVRESRDLMRQVLRRPVGASMRLDVVRGGRPVQLTLTTTERPDAEREESQELGASTPSPARSDEGWGLQLTPVTPQLARQIGYAGRNGAVVVHVRQGSPGDRAGLGRGDVIIEADRQAVRSPSEVEEAVRDGRALLRVQRGDRSFYAVLERE
jgi:Do/DeqQ family serine protease